MKIIQIKSVMIKGDGATNVVFAMDELLKKAGFDTEIYDGILKRADIKSELFSSDNIIIYHFSNRLDPIVKYLKCKKIMAFHNITEPELLEQGCDESIRTTCAAGLYEASTTYKIFDRAIVFSEYSKETLCGMKWKDDKIDVVPIMMRFEKLSLEPDMESVKKYLDGKKNIIFTGRIFPHKKQEDIIAAFAEYKKEFDESARLLLVGQIQSVSYYNSLLKYIHVLGLEEDVIITGHVSFKEYLAYYQIADLFVCASAHEGFCIPLVEAMYFKVPILAVDSTAVTGTLGGCGELVYVRDAKILAEKIHLILSDNNYGTKLIEGQQKRLEELLPEKLEAQYYSIIVKCIDELARLKKVQDEDQGEVIAFEYIEEDDDTKDIKRPKDFEENSEIVIWGMGNAGQKLYEQLKLNKKIVGLCDAQKGGKELYDSREILTPDEAIKEYNGAAYIISVQNRKAIADIAQQLGSNGISNKFVYLYDMNANQIL